MVAPFVSVIMPVYNREEFIQEAVNSILAQTHQDFELLIIDDASTDRTLEIIDGFNDDRIRTFSTKENKGVSSSRNKGIEEAKGEYIAFMDSDDISIPTRLEKQIKILIENEEIAVCGCWLSFMDSTKLIKHKENHNEIISRLLIHCSLSIGAVMIKRFILDKERLRPDLKYGEDYEFWTRICWLGKFYNIQEPLLNYRSHPEQISRCHKAAQTLIDIEIRLSLFKKLNYSTNKFPDLLISKFFHLKENVHLNELRQFLAWLKNIRVLNLQQGIFPHKQFVEVLEEIRADLMFKLYFENTDVGIDKVWRLKALLLLSKKEILYILNKKMK